MPESNRVSVVHSAIGLAPSPVLDSLGARISVSSSVDADGAERAGRSSTGIAALEALTQLSPTELATFATTNPAGIGSILATPPAASAVTGWWLALDTAERTVLETDVPQLVGNLDGVPLLARSAANARYLGEAMSTAAERLTAHPERSERQSATRQLSVMSEITKALLSACTSPPRSLVLLDLADGGRAAIALGDPDTADFVSYLVPGMNYGVREQLVNWSTTADDLYAEQVQVLRDRAEVTRSSVPSVATIAWIGYETPSLFTVGGLTRADAGADFLVDSWDGIRSTRTDRQPFLSVFAHSYGSLVALEALGRNSVQVDALVMVGSPGSAIQSIDRLDVADGNVYVGEADWDPAVNSGFFGSDPGADSYGAHTLGVDGESDPVTGRSLSKSWGHNDYFTPGSESLRNMALIGTDQAALVTGASE
ncbi:alpha/beta hydrolase [Cryobacterium sp. CG_9.6]|uniref:alpha/beta hydrolase n=1 Tax=Cryobacterium sp. CG_9.6 TaxID=2760710 RepID=UPI002473E66E|nr:alpha/beta hydrolase [Cryobacterium sp. CG_9.6]MDH6237460.1 pimeloyl-ACP methyl ester carboxylesterase [Cryobacterium sp. CG_9.6]